MAKDLSPADQVKFAKMGHATLSDKFGGSYVVKKKKTEEGKENLYRLGASSGKSGIPLAGSQRAKKKRPADEPRYGGLKPGEVQWLKPKKANEDTRKPVHSMAKKAAELISSLVAPKP